MALLMTKTRIKVVCFFYNEEFLLPFFLSHYAWADEIHAVVSTSTDRTEVMLHEYAALAKNHQIVTIEKFDFPAGMDDFIKRDKVNEIIGRSYINGWVIVVDADEFIWPSNATGSGLLWILRNGKNLSHVYLDQVDPRVDVLYAKMWNVYRHKTDKDLDPTDEPVVLQRRHGDPDRNSPGNAQYQKPIVVRANRGVKLDIGNHRITAPGRITTSASDKFDGVHWQNADPSFCVRRRIKERRDRQSDSNRRCGLGSQHHHIQEEDVRLLCKAHEFDPQCF